ncbi:FHA domain-containing protein DDL [Prosopis cineraria]|uniref:FHA domain-containing protein DDL n=1 Tax=Prosopis cineraria TaxID=364024 RepID=UPI00240F36FF|nr:FHA domain-containing protein DDL [Prosopis cineraria]
MHNPRSNKPKGFSGAERSPVSYSRKKQRKERERERGKDRESSPPRRHRHSHSNRHDVSPERDRSISPPPPEKRRHSSRGSAKLVRESSESPVAPTRSPSPSPRAKRLKRAQADRGSEKNHEGGRGTDWDRDRDRGRGSDRDMGTERKEKRSSGRDEVDDTHNDIARNRSSKSRHERPTNSPEHHRNGRNRHRSPSPQQLIARDEMTNSRGVEHRNDDNDSVAKMKAAEEALEEKQKQKPSFELSGKLAAETNRVRGVTLLFNEPSEARKPDIKWRLYVFKGGEVLNEPLYIHRQSCYLFGRERRVADIPTDHPSCSKQHAVIQFRQVEKEQPDGMMSKQVRPYLMDLGSTNKTFINDNPIEPQRYYELREKDTIRFGNSSREYVLLHENSIG